MDFQDLLKQLTNSEQKMVAVAAAEDVDVLEAVALAIEQNLCFFTLYGDKEKMLSLIDEHFPYLEKSRAVQLVHTVSNAASAEHAVQSVRLNHAEVLMKGNLPTAMLLKAVLNKEFGLRTGKILSHVAVFSVEGNDDFLFLTDAGMNIAPDVNEKAQIIQNAVWLAKSLGVQKPKVAPLAAVEVINPNMKATMDAALLTQMNRRGQITDCEVDGPLALDIAVSIEAAEHKGIKGSVAGRANILLAPTIEAGNILYKSFMYFAHAKVGAVIAGANAPIVLTSRADSAESKLHSLAVALYSSQRQ